MSGQFLACLERDTSSRLLAAVFPKRDRQRGETAQSQVCPPDQPAGLEGEAGQTPQQSLDRNLALDARKRRAEAEVGSPRKGDVSVVRASDVEPVRIRKPFRIPVRGGNDRN